MVAFLLGFIFVSVFAKEPSTVPETKQTEPSSYINTQLLSAPDKAKAIEIEDLSILKRYHPFYFAFGDPTSKLQVSFKALLIRDVPFYFGYTQLMFWDLMAESKPFRDLTYNPELFYRFQFKNLMLKSVDVGGWAHNSNGKAGAESRSYDKTYLRANFETQSDRWIIRFSPEVAYLFGFDKTNSDIDDYISPFSLTISFIQLFESWIDKGEFSLKISPAGKYANHWDRGGYQASYSFRLGGLKFVPAFYLQYYRGYAETLLNYNQNVDVFRVGFLF